MTPSMKNWESKKKTVVVGVSAIDVDDHSDHEGHDDHSEHSTKVDDHSDHEGHDDHSDHSGHDDHAEGCLLYTSPSPRDGLLSRMPSSA